MTPALPPLTGSIIFSVTSSSSAEPVQFQFIARPSENDPNDSTPVDIGKKNIKMYKQTSNTEFHKFQDKKEKKAEYFLKPPSEDEDYFESIRERFFVDKKMVGFGYFKNRSPFSLQFFMTGWFDRKFC